MKNFEDIKSKSQFLSGFGSDDIIEEFYLKENQELRPGSILSENDEEYKLEIGVPFIREKDLKVKLENDRLVVSADRQTPKKASSKVRTYKGIFHITDDIIKDKIDVTFNYGLLTIIFPKNKIKRKHQNIDIK